MITVPGSSIGRFALLFGLTFFFGMAFEELYAKNGPARPGGVRTFPLLSLVGALLFLLDSTYKLAFSIGLLLLGSFLLAYYWRHIEEQDAEGRPNVTLAPSICNILAYILGPLSLTAPPWMAVGVTVAAVLLLVERERLHQFARGLPVGEIVTAGQFLILTGLILPLLPSHPVTSLTSITPRQVWLAVVAVCSISYAGYLLQRYVIRKGGGAWIGTLGGLYSSTAATVALARAMKRGLSGTRDARTGIVLATAVMYPRLLLVIAVFNLRLAARLAPFLLGLFVLAAAGAWALRSLSQVGLGETRVQREARNPLDIVAALVFAALFVAISVASSWAGTTFGAAGVFSLAAVVGFSDIDPFVLSLAQGAAAPLSLNAVTAAILIAASSNNLLKAGYAGAFAGLRPARDPIIVLVLLAAVGVALAVAVA